MEVVIFSIFMLACISFRDLVLQMNFTVCQRGRYSFPQELAQLKAIDISHECFKKQHSSCGFNSKVSRKIFFYCTL